MGKFNLVFFFQTSLEATVSGGRSDHKVENFKSLGLDRGDLVNYLILVLQ